jgi:hypothetical protein
MPGRHSPESAQTVDRYAGASSGLRRMANSVSQLSRRAQRAKRACVSGQRLTQLITVISGKRDGEVVVMDCAPLAGVDAGLFRVCLQSVECGLLRNWSSGKAASSLAGQ